MSPAEEVDDASRTLPRSIMWSVYLNGAMGFIMAITMCFCLGDLSQVVDSPTGYPFIQVFYNATKSYTATNIMVTIMVVTLTACCVSEVATASRQLWSFARDKGVPFSNWLAYVRLLLLFIMARLTFGTGVFFDAHTSSCSPRFPVYHLPGIVDQYRVYCCVERYRLPQRRGPLDLLFYRHRLRGLQACEGRAIATTEMVSWKIWSGD